MQRVQNIYTACQGRACSSHVTIVQSKCMELNAMDIYICTNPRLLEHHDYVTRFSAWQL